MKKKQGFTLIELLVVIAIIAMLLAILMPALGKVKKMAQRLVCGTNLKGMANALNVYAFDYRDEFPIAGGKAGARIWSDTTDFWAQPDKPNKDKVTISASLYMLIREADVGPKSFVCKSSSEQPFQIPSGVNLDMTELWDFGDGSAAADSQTPGLCQSYSYQVPYTVNTLTHPADGTSNPGNAVMADRSPYFDNDLTYSGSMPVADSFMEMVALINPDADKPHWVKVGNSAAHDREGQNVLFGDGHVGFEKRPDVGNRYDNIYAPFAGPSPWDEIDRRKGEGKWHMVNKAMAKSSEDTNLVNDFYIK